MESTSSTKSVILPDMKEAPQEFISWLRNQIDVRNWGVREAARGLGLSHPTISDALLGKQPSFDTCLAVAKAFDVSPIYVLTLAGLLPAQGDPAKFEDWKLVLEQLSEHDRDELLEFARLKVRRQNEERTRINGKLRKVEG